tara:strand:+ start:149 stop:382 length:234 start_codon:yes stop_codon:yes gene_type:complete
MHKYNESRKRARLRWRHSDKGKAWDKAYSQRECVKKKAHEYYIEKKIRDYQKEMDELKNNNNDLLHAQNSIRFVDYE